MNPDEPIAPMFLIAPDILKEMLTGKPSGIDLLDKLIIVAKETKDDPKLQMHFCTTASALLWSIHQSRDQLDTDTLMAILDNAEIFEWMPKEMPRNIAHLPLRIENHMQHWMRHELIQVANALAPDNPKTDNPKTPDEQKVETSTTLGSDETPKKDSE